MVTRRSEKEGEKNRVLDVGFYVGGVEVVGKTWDWVGGLDHRPVEMVVEVVGEELIRRGEREGKVDWERVEAELRLMEGMGGEDVVRREELERRVECLENRVMEVVKRNRGRGKWKYGKKVWWNGEIEKEYEKVKEEERRWMGSGRKEGMDRVKESRKKWKKKVEEVKREHWVKYLEGLDERDGYKWVKTDRDFLVDIPGIRNEEGRVVEEDGEKARALVRGLGKREEEEQELEGFYERIEVEEEELEEMIKKQRDGKAAGENGLGGKVFKIMWRVDWCRKEIKEVVEGSLSLGYVCERWRRSVGIVIRKPNKVDYGSPNSYRIINLLDVLGKVVERLLARRLERWGQDGMGDEQFGGRVGRSCMDGVGKLYKDWEEGGRKGLLLCMDVKGGYENVGVNKAVERLEGLGVDEYMVRWISSFLRERRVKVKIGGRLSEWVEMKGGPIQGSPLSPILFMFVLGGVLEEVRREEVEGVSMIGCVDDVDFMVVGESEEVIVERVKRMETGLVRGLRKWEVDVQELKLEGLWMKRDSEEWGRDVEWLGEDIKLRESMRVLGVWWQKNGGYEEHLKQRLVIGGKR